MKVGRLIDILKGCNVNLEVVVESPRSFIPLDIQRVFVEVLDNNSQVVLEVASLDRRWDGD